MAQANSSSAVPRIAAPVRFAGDRANNIMWLILLEAFGALVVLVLIVWWTMFAGRRGGERKGGPPPE